MRTLIATAIIGLSCLTPARAEPVQNWQQTGEDEFIWLNPADWQAFAANYQSDIGLVSSARYSVAWREGREFGIWIEYNYDQPVSPPNLPGPGPLKLEVVEATINCDAQTVRIHNMYLFNPDFGKIGIWYDPSAEKNPAHFDSGSVIGKAADKFC